MPVLVKEMEGRYDLIKAPQGIAPGTPDEEITSDIWGLTERERPVPVVLFVNEVAERFMVATKKDEGRRDETVTQLIRLAQLGRAAGIYLEVRGQRFGAELGKRATMLRAQLTGRVCHRVNDVASAKMALGDIAPEAVSAACSIAPERPGLAVAGDTSGGWSRIRTPYLSLGNATKTWRRMAMTTAAPAPLPQERVSAAAHHLQHGGPRRVGGGQAAQGAGVDGRAHPPLEAHRREAAARDGPDAGAHRPLPRPCRGGPPVRVVAPDRLPRAATR